MLLARRKSSPDKRAFGQRGRSLQIMQLTEITTNCILPMATTIFQSRSGGIQKKRDRETKHLKKTPPKTLLLVIIGS